MKDALAGAVKRFAAIALAALVACATVEPPAAPAPAFEEALGVRVEGLRLSAAGYMLDFRYRVLDAQKAKPLFDRKARPVLLDTASGAKVTVPDAPKLGQLRTTGSRPVKEGRTYSIMFANPGRTIEPGSRVTLVAGAARLEGLRVE